MQEPGQQDSSSQEAPDSSSAGLDGDTCHLLSVQAPITRTFSASALSRARSSAGSVATSPHRFSFWDSLVSAPGVDQSGQDGGQTSQPGSAASTSTQHQLLFGRAKW